MSDPIDRLPERLGARLKLAREAAGLSVSDLAQKTHVRRAYLEALEEGRYGELPEDVYARNFVRLYGQALGLDPAPLVAAYLRERQAALGVTTLEQRLDRDRRSLPAAATSAGAGSTRSVRSTSRGWPAWLFGPWIATVGLVAVVVVLALWGFNRLFATPSGAPSDPPGASASVDAAAPIDAAAAIDAAAPDPSAGAPAPPIPGDGDAMVRLQIVTDPPGAEVTIDGFPLPGRTPLLDVPVTARAGRVVRAELDGYEPAEARYDLVVDGRVELVLTPRAAAGTPAAVAVAADRVSITITDATWLEVYRSGARNEGERLVFTTAQAGATYEFALPVYVYVGNAAGARVNLGGQDLGPMGAPGAVLGRAFGR